MSGARQLDGFRKKEAWRRFADEIGGEYVDETWTAVDGTEDSKVQVSERGRLITLETPIPSAERGMHTRISTPYTNREAYAFTVHRAAPLDSLGKTLMRFADILVGDPELDGALLIKGNHHAMVRSLLRPPRIRELIRDQASIHLALGDGRSWFGGYSRDELRLLVAGVVVDLGRLKDLYELFTEILGRLEHVDLFIEVLLAPGGTVPLGGAVLGKGDGPRHRAAAGLARLKNPKAIEALGSVLDDPDRILVMKALRALGEIGDPKAVPILIPLLGDRRKVGVHSPVEYATEALIALGAGALVSAFEHALEGRIGPLKTAVGEYHLAFVDAFMRALSSPEPNEFTHAVDSLGELRAVEALPILRVKLRDHGSWELGRVRCRRVITKLESLASLPRPTEQPGTDTSTLPRPIDSTEEEA